MKSLILLVTAALIVVGGVIDVTAQDAPSSPVKYCVNMGNTLEAPNEGEWGFVIQEDYFTVLADAGFESIRLPVRWSAHAEESAPYTIDPDFFERIDEVIGWALDAGLQVVLNIHHYEEIMSDPAAHRERLIGIWEQIAAHYADSPPALIFEALNEPNNALDADLWNPLQADVIATIRETNPERWIVIGGEWWNSIDGLLTVEPPDDQHLIATFHFYEPFEFTHQGAEWATGSDAWLGTTWGSDQDYANMLSRLQTAADWGAEHGIPVLMGEFGAYSRADMDSRIAWTTAAREISENLGIGWCYWEFAAGFGIYDRNTYQFNAIYEALIPVAR